MPDGPGVDVHPEALRAVAAGLRADAGALETAEAVANEAAQSVAWCRPNAPLPASAIALSAAIGRALGAARHDIEDVARALEETARSFETADHTVAGGFGQVPPPR